jgi:hypothetical protein
MDRSVLSIPRSGTQIRTLWAETTAPNKIQFNGVGGLRAYISSVLISEALTWSSG